MIALAGLRLGLLLLPLWTSAVEACSPMQPREAQFTPPGQAEPAPLPPPPVVEVLAASAGGNPEIGGSCWDLGRLMLVITPDPRARGYAFEVTKGSSPIQFPALPQVGYVQDSKQHFQFSWLQAEPRGAVHFKLKVTAHSIDGAPGGATELKIYIPATLKSASAQVPE